MVTVERTDGRTEKYDTKRHLEAVQRMTGNKKSILYTKLLNSNVKKIYIDDECIYERG